jgi:C4-dicarboxylate transporter DctM subunit
MTYEAWIGVIGFAILLTLIFLRVWVGFSLMIVGIAGIIFLRGFGYVGGMIANDPFTTSTGYTMTCLPMFTVMGTIISHTGLGAKLYRWARALIGHVRGGLGMATVFACALFAAICGNSQITALTLGRIAYPEMRKAGYGEGIAAGGIAAAGGIGVMIPPSVGFILYGLLTEQSIGRLFMCGLIPGIALTLLYCSVYFIVGCRRKDLVPTSAKADRKELIESTKEVWPVILLMVILLGGIYGGIFTATEAGAIGVVASIIIAFASSRGSVNRQLLYDAFVDGLMSTGMVMILLVGAKIFLRFISLTQLTAILGAWITGLNVSRYVILAIVFVVYLILGSCFDILSAVLLTVPFLYPIMTSLGFDPLWFGVFVVGMMEMGDITPPIGLSGFVIAEAFKLPTKTVFGGVAPFILCQFIFMVLICIFPQIALLLA